MKTEVMVQGNRIERSVDIAAGKKGGKCGCEAETSAGFRVIKRFNPQTVPCKYQPAAVPLPYGEREHALEPPHALLSPSMVALQDNLGVSFGKESIALAQEF